MSEDDLSSVNNKDLDPYQDNPLYTMPNDCCRQHSLFQAMDAHHMQAEQCKLKKEISELGWLPFQKDYARLLHSASFRRLQGKVQLFPSAEDDFFRNRLTHSLEVAQIGVGIARFLNAKQIPNSFGKDASVDVDLVQFAGLAHDIGHPPFGHNGEHELDQLMMEHGGFEGNAQTLRIISSLERKLIVSGEHQSEEFGLNLTSRALASVLKYDEIIEVVRKNATSPVKGYYSQDEELVNLIKNKIAPGYDGKNFKTIECSIMDIADDIAYSTYDLDDALHAGFILPIQLVNEFRGNETIKSNVLEKVNKALEKAAYPPANYHEVLARLSSGFNLSESINSEDSTDDLEARIQSYQDDIRLMKSSTARTLFTAWRVGDLIKKVKFVKCEEYPQLSTVKLEREALILVEALKRLNYELNIRSSLLSVVEYRGREYIKQIFNALVDSDGSLLPEEWREEYNNAKHKGKTQSFRVVCDYIAGMTDRHAAEFHGRLFGNGHSIFKPL